MSMLWHVGYVAAGVLGLAYVAVPRRVHAAGLESLRRSTAAQSDGSTAPIWLYRGLGVLLLVVGVTGLR